MILTRLKLLFHALIILLIDFVTIFLSLIVFVIFMPFAAFDNKIFIAIGGLACKEPIKKGVNKEK